MKHFSRIAVPVVLATLALVVIVVGVQANGVLRWPVDGIPVIKASYDQANQRVVSDGAGGVILAWDDQRGGGAGYSDIYAQRLNAAGQVLWNSQGVTVASSVWEQRLPDLVGDGEHGAIIAWQDRRAGLHTDIYAQRILSDGTAAWLTQGISIAVVGGDKRFVRVATDRNGGAVLAWLDMRSGTYYDVYAQRVASDGSVQWTTDGVYVGRVTTNTQSIGPVAGPVIASDGDGGALIAWKNLTEDNHSDVWAQHVLSNGVPSWGAQGINVSNQGNADSPAIISDENGGAILVWGSAWINASSGIFAQRLTADGFALWGSVGITLDVGVSSGVQGISDGMHGAFIAWQAVPTLTISNTVTAIRAQRVMSDSTIAWATPSVTVSVDSFPQAVRLVNDGYGGVIAIGNTMVYSLNKLDCSLWGQRIDANGITQWGSGGVSIAQHVGRMYADAASASFALASDMSHGAVVVWADLRYSTDFDLYAQRLVDFTATAWVYLPMIRK